jgi:hypothetical protein
MNQHSSGSELFDVLVVSPWGIIEVTHVPGKSMEDAARTVLLHLDEYLPAALKRPNRAVRYGKLDEPPSCPPNGR